ncbi:uncharacterized protein Tco025E_03881 [Trypanosoma conorhini]|uniref:Uncharacterized protein n=1 Tax=Trypanosoma conorhini TaxID=83891 RepID=A0A422PQQ4_9TRYP|nr:uncharacterized protein Tco025E_03881 [Trypanosoma conorhini]RNF20052.1 hypothetical protein Tco025E_03881 [Trypanosoma conorhini]
MTEGRRPVTLRCWDACLQYELSRAEAWAEVRRDAFTVGDGLWCAATPSIMDATAVLALRHVACDYLAATREELAEVIRTFKRERTETDVEVGAERLSLRNFLLLLEPLTLVANASAVLEEFFKGMLQRDRLCAQCVLEAADAGATLEAQEQASREELLSSCRRWRHTRSLQGRLQQQCMHLSTLHALDSGDVAEGVKVSLIRRAVRVEEERRQQHFATVSSAMERIVRITDALETLHDQLRVAEEYEALALAPLLGEQSDRIAHAALQASRRAHWDSRLSCMERRLGILGRFAVGLSLVSLGRRTHNTILRQMQETSAGSAATGAAAAPLPATGGLAWLAGDGAVDPAGSYYCASTAASSGASVPDTASSLSALLQQCLCDATSYVAAPGAVSSHGGWEVPSVEDRREVEGVLRQAFVSLTRLNYLALPFLQEFAATLDTVVLFPSFELFLTECQLRVIGSSKLAFFTHCSRRLDAGIVAYLKSLVRREGSWVAEYGMCFDDFLAFLVDQAAVEYVRHAYLLPPKTLLTRILLEIVVPRWLNRLRRGESPPCTAAAASSSTDAERAGAVMRVVATRDGSGGDDGDDDNDDLCLLLDTALTWLGIAGRSLRDFAQAYRTHVVDYAFAMPPEPNSSGVTTTGRLMALLFPATGTAPGLRCHPARWEALRRTHGSSFAALNALVGGDGSLDSVAAWLTLGVDGVEREDLVRRSIDAIERILCATADPDVCFATTPHKLPAAVSHTTPVSWILALAVCVRLAFRSDLATCGLDELLQRLTVPR